MAKQRPRSARGAGDATREGAGEATREGAGEATREGAGEATREGAEDAAREESTREALARARGHLRAALGEATEALRALLDATSLATSGAPAEDQPALQRVAKTLDELSAQLSGDGPGLSPPLVGAILDALDAEIGRWELRSESDPEARAVLRAFIGVREILWEFGVRRDREQASAEQSAAPRRGRATADKDARGRPAARARRPRVQRVDVKG